MDSYSYPYSSSYLDGGSDYNYDDESDTNVDDAPRHTKKTAVQPPAKPFCDRVSAWLAKHGRDAMRALVIVLIFAAFVPGVCLVAIGSRPPWNATMFGVGLGLAIPGSLVILLCVVRCCMELWCP
jgi:hypothetical protein